jgi:eukaryotic-like serine/threonine-protein kinase
MPPSTNHADDGLTKLGGRSFQSQFVPGVEYRLGPQVGQGAMAVAFYALRTAPEGYCPVVIKMLRPSFYRQYGQAATLTVQKEAVALGRLNERVPSTPFVVRLIDTGHLGFSDKYGPIELPWIAVEYVHGGPEGTTLTQRVTRSVQDTGAAFDMQRAGQAIECLCAGLAAVHEVGVIHRDMKPGNVLCCGSGDEEIFKVADFGVARPQGLAGTFFRDFVGTLGYVAPEAFGSRGTECGPWTDVFGLAGVVYFLLTGQKYLQVNSTAEMLVQMGTDERRSVLESPMLCPELRRREVACRAIDRALASATALDPKDRPSSAETFAAHVLPWLQPEAGSHRPSPSSRVVVGVGRPRWSDGPPWTWILRHRPSDSLCIRRVAWDADGRCLAVTNQGLAFWTGTGWRQVPQAAIPPDELRLVHRTGPSRWLVGYGQASLASFSSDGMLDAVDLSSKVRRLEAFDGELGDLAVLIDCTDNGRPLLRAMSAWRWVRPIPLERVTAISSLARVGDAQWLIAGRGADDAGLVAVYSPLEFEMKLLPTPPVRAFVACAGRESLETGVACGADGAILWWQESRIELETVEGGQDVSAVAVDPAGRGWAAGAGRIWHRETAEGWSAWTCVWEDENWHVPFVSLFADVGLVIAVTADGAILEGREADTDRDTEFMAESESV